MPMKSVLLVVFLLTCHLLTVSPFGIQTSMRVGRRVVHVTCALSEPQRVRPRALPKGAELRTDLRGKTRDAVLEEQAQQAAKSAALGSRYDPIEAEKYFNLRTLDVWRRDMQISVPFTTFLGQVLLDFQRGVEKVNRPRRAKEFMELIANLGPAFIKAGQALSSRPDLLPPEYLQELQKLQDRLPPFPNKVAFKIIEEQLGMKVQDIFERVEPEPVAAASIGQVYKAYLKTGEAVAIKVQRPECEEVIALDIYILRELSGTLSQMIKLLRRDLDLRSVVEEFGKLIYEEIDYLQEARNAERFAELYGNNPDIYVPKIFWRFSSRKVLVMEWVEGVRLTSPLLSDKDKTSLVRAMVQCSLQQMLEKGFFHADPHGGNLLATSDGKLVYLDFGMMSEVEPYQRYGILEAVIHLVNRDFASLCKLYVRLGFIPPGTDVRPIEEALTKALPDVLGSSVETFNIKNVIGELGDVMYKFPFNLPPYYTAIVRCLGVLEGLAIQVDGKFRIINDAYPYIASRVLTDSQLQDALEYMVLTRERKVRWQRLENLLQSASDFDEWDLSQASRLFLDFIFSEQNEHVRENMVDDLTDFVDGLGLEALDYLLSSSRVILPDLLRSRPLADSTSIPPLPSSLRDALGRLELLRSSPFLDRFLQRPDRVTALARDVYESLRQKPQAQKFLLEASSHLFERASSRMIRLLFQMPQLPPSQLPRITQSLGHTRALTGQQ
uniref:Protein kinase domain-containing protein n=1 Tax=Hanusia phi TaxID=3032 RepID=A0A7S0HX77_9CRYP|mmetsp:Transcript_55/g.157  ORF Transcript_55/g.157 Transcript_55/m.157 type:complete len:723 (+) Transcript_55:73-2241(+)